MADLIIITGRVGRNAELRYTPSGLAVASFSVASNRQYTGNNGETVKETKWFRISAWGRQAEVCNQYVKKGMTVRVDGRLTADNASGGPRIWSGNDGSPRTSFEVTAMNVEFLSRADESGIEQDAGDMLPPDEEIPF